MSRHTPEARRLERAEWIRGKIEAGCSQHDIALALGIDQSTISTTMANYGISKPRPLLVASKLSSIGVRLGRMDEFFNMLPGEMRDSLVDEAARRGDSIVQVVARRLQVGEN